MSARTIREQEVVVHNGGDACAAWTSRATGPRSSSSRPGICPAIEQRLGPLYDPIAELSRYDVLYRRSRAR